jgi:hypothetical protein
MTDLLPIIMIVVPAILVSAFYIFIVVLRRQEKQTKISEIKSGQGVISAWNYSPEEWKHATENYFDIKSKNYQEIGKVCFTKDYILVYNQNDEVLFELIGKQSYTKHLTEVRLLKQSPMNNLRFEVRTKKIKKNDDDVDTMEEDYGVEILNVPVPKDCQIEQEKMLKYYQDILDKSADAIAAVMPYGLGMFGR